MLHRTRFVSYADATIRRKTGKVKSWFPLKGFGFIVDDASQREVFCHYRDITAGPATATTTEGSAAATTTTTTVSSKFKSLQVGELVEFDMVVVNDKPRAANVTGPDGSSVKGIPVSATPTKPATPPKPDAAEAEETPKSE
eukprot:PhM_4_TR11820/c0_g1_i1/m.52621